MARLTYSYHEFRDNASTCQKVANPLVFISTILDMLQVDYEETDADPIFIFTHRLAGVYREQFDNLATLSAFVRHNQGAVVQFNHQHFLETVMETLSQTPANHYVDCYLMGGDAPVIGVYYVTDANGLAKSARPLFGSTEAIAIITLKRRPIHALSIKRSS